MADSLSLEFVKQVARTIMLVCVRIFVSAPFETKLLEKNALLRRSSIFFFYFFRSFFNKLEHREREKTRARRSSFLLRVKIERRKMIGRENYL